MKYLIFILSLAFSTATTAQTKHALEAKSNEKAPAAQEATGIEPGTAQSAAVLQPPAVYTFVEQMPEPSVDMNTYIGKNVRYPDSARKNSIQGRVVVKFVVNEDGTLSNVEAIRGIGYGCDEEAVRVIKSMPRWKPGKQGGKAVKVNFNQPVLFKLQ